MNPQWDDWTLPELDEALEVDPGNAALWRAKVSVLLRLNRWAEAQACLRRVMDLADDGERDWYRRGPPSHPLAHWHPAGGASRCLESEVMRARGLALTYIGRYSEAIACYDRALDLAPHNGLAWRGRATTLDRMARHEDPATCSGQDPPPGPGDAVLCW